MPSVLRNARTHRGNWQGRLRAIRVPALRGRRQVHGMEEHLGHAPAIDYLVTRDEVDAKRIGCYGHSMGSTIRG